MPKFFRSEKRFGAAIKTIRPEIWNGWLATGLMRETPDACEITERGWLWTTNMMRDAIEGGEAQIADGALIALEKRPGVRTGTFRSMRSDRASWWPAGTRRETCGGGR